MKTRLLLSECQRRGHSLHYVPIDISESMLRETAANLTADYPMLQIDALATDYENGLVALPAAPQRLVLFLGSNLGNFTESEQNQLFSSLASSLQIGDYFLLGLDLRKSVTILESAYNDTAGVGLDCCRGPGGETSRCRSCSWGDHRGNRNRWLNQQRQ